MNKRALLFGMNHYTPNYSIVADDLASTINDVNILGKRLKQLDFEIKSCMDYSLNNMRDAIIDFAKDAPCDSLNIIYFSGHGGHSLGQNYIYPIDFGTNLDKGLSIEDSACNIQHFTSAFKREVKLILIIDACRVNTTPLYNDNYSEMAAPKNTYIAYATQFNEPSVCTTQLSYFTEAICENILTPNISIDRLFINIRAALYLKYDKQISNSVNGFMEYVTFNYQPQKDDVANSVLDFVDKYGDIYIDKYGCFAGDDLIFIDAAQYCDISTLDAIYKYLVLDEKRCHVTSGLTEAHHKLIAFWNMLGNGLKQDEYYTWQYRGRPIRLGEIPPLPLDMQKPMPDPQNQINVTFSIIPHEKNIEIQTNLPNLFPLYGRINDKFSYNAIVQTGKAYIPLHENVDELHTLSIHSIASNLLEVDKSIIGDKGRNLVGENVKFNPIYGNTINLYYKTN